jgi:hypothetical protein
MTCLPAVPIIFVDNLFGWVVDVEVRTFKEIRHSLRAVYHALMESIIHPPCIKKDKAHFTNPKMISTNQ